MFENSITKEPLEWCDPSLGGSRFSHNTMFVTATEPSAAVNGPNFLVLGLGLIRIKVSKSQSRSDINPRYQVQARPIRDMCPTSP